MSMVLPLGVIAHTKLSIRSLSIPSAIVNLFLAILLALGSSVAQVEAKTHQYKFDYTVTSFHLNETDWPYLGITLGESSQARLSVEVVDDSTLGAITFSSPGIQLTKYDYEGFNNEFEEDRFYGANYSLGYFLNRFIRSYDNQTKRIDFYAADLDLLNMKLDPITGSGSGSFGWEYDGGASWAYVGFETEDVSMVPLPASGLMLGATGLILLGSSRRPRQRS